jgi:hypothetical protein
MDTRSSTNPTGVRSRRQQLRLGKAAGADGSAAGVSTHGSSRRAQVCLGVIASMMGIIWPCLEVFLLFGSEFV